MIPYIGGPDVIVEPTTGKKLLELDQTDIHILRQLPETTRKEVNKNVQDYIKQTGKDYHVTTDSTGSAQAI